MNGWEDLEYWQSDDWKYVQLKLSDLEENNVQFNPRRECMFRAIDLIRPDCVKVVFIGQDPYPDPRLATGIAFSIPPEFTAFPPTLQTIFKEYENDLSLASPRSGSLLPWVHSGVLLWNVYPTCNTLRSLSHQWPEYYSLSKAIVEYLSSLGSIVFVFLGSHSRSLSKYVDVSNNKIIELCHPSIRANIASRTELKFLGSRVFTRTNAYLRTLGKPKIDWRLP